MVSGTVDSETDAVGDTKRLLGDGVRVEVVEGLPDGRDDSGRYQHSGADVDGRLGIDEGVASREVGQPATDAVDVVGSAHELESVEVRNGALTGDDVAREAVLLAEVRVPSGNDATDQRTIVCVVQEFDDLLRHETVASRRRRFAATVGGTDQDVGLVDLEHRTPSPLAVENRDARDAHSQLLDKPMRVLRHR